MDEVASIIRVRSLEKCFGKLYVLQGIDLDMDDGVWVEEGTPEEMFDNPKDPRTKDFLRHIL